jgi:hypothetical protein
LTDQGDPILSRFGLSHSAIERIKTSSAVNPLLWLAAFATPSALVGAYFLPDYRLFFISIILAVIAAPIIAYFIFLFRDPNRLQSEHYQLENQRLMLGDDRHPGVVLSPRAMVSNPAAPSIEHQP